MWPTRPHNEAFRFLNTDLLACRKEMGFFSCFYFSITSTERESLSLLELASSSLLLLLAPHPMTVLVVAADMGDKMKQCRWKRVVAK